MTDYRECTTTTESFPCSESVKKEINSATHENPLQSSPGQDTSFSDRTNPPILIAMRAIQRPHRKKSSLLARCEYRLGAVWGDELWPLHSSPELEATELVAVGPRHSFSCRSRAEKRGHANRL